jgi:hypothetical protein
MYMQQAAQTPQIVRKCFWVILFVVASTEVHLGTIKLGASKKVTKQITYLRKKLKDMFIRVFLRKRDVPNF